MPCAAAPALSVRLRVLAGEALKVLAYSRRMVAKVPAGARFEWRGEVSDDELAELTRSHGGRPEPGWWDRVRPHSLGWVTARGDEGVLIGFVNVAWDGGDHAFLIDTKVRPDQQRRGIGTQLVRVAAEHGREAG